MATDRFSKENRESEARPRYSIIITCYNQQEFIQDAVESVLAQGCEAKEIIVVDDGSSDHSLSIVRKFEPNVTVLALGRNCGVGVARNQGAELASGEYLLFLDGDDLLTPWAFDVYEELINTYHPAAIMSGAKWFAGPLAAAQTADWSRRLEFVEYESLMARDRGTGMYTGAFVIDRLTFQRAGGWSPELWHLDGQDLYAKLAYSGKAILVLSPYTMLYRMHASNSIKSVEPYLRAAQLVMDRARSGFYPALPHKTLQRQARHGGVIAFCIKRLWLAGYYRQAFLLSLRALPMILAAVIYKPMILLKGRHPIQVREWKAPHTSFPAALIETHK